MQTPFITMLLPVCVAYFLVVTLLYVWPIHDVPKTKVSNRLHATVSVFKVRTIFVSVLNREIQV